MRKILVCSCWTMVSLVCFGGSAVCAQRSYTGVGVRVGVGAPLPSTHPSIGVNNTTTNLNASLVYSGGVSVQYLLANKIGLESGLMIYYSSFSKETGTTSAKELLGWNSFADLYNYKVPVILVYNMPIFRRNSLKALAGPSLNYIYNGHDLKYNGYDVKLRAYSLYTVNYIAELRISSSKSRYGKFEYGILVQFPKSRNLMSFTDPARNNFQLNFKTNLLAFNLSYFFYNRNSE